MVFGTKFHLSKHYQKQDIWADVNEDEKTGEVWLGDDQMFVATMEDHIIKMKYKAGWEEWLKSEEFPEFKDILDTLAQKLSKGTPGKGSVKGTGKSKGKASGKPSRR